MDEVVGSSHQNGQNQDNEEKEEEEGEEGMQSSADAGKKKRRRRRKPTLITKEAVEIGMVSSTVTSRTEKAATQLLYYIWWGCFLYLHVNWWF